jgi:hypothetical protein
VIGQLVATEQYGELLSKLNPRFQQDSGGLVAWGGRFSRVFPFSEGGREWCLRVPLEEPDDAYVRRYRHLEDLEATTRLRLGIPEIRSLDSALQWEVNGATLPIHGQVIERKTGRHLCTLLREDHEDSTGLHVLCSGFSDRILNANAHPFAHGDIQDANIIVDEAGQVFFVDFDDCYLEGLSPHGGVAGHPNFSHPSAERQWGVAMDTFAALVVVVGLRAVAVDPTLWERYGDDEAVLFTKHDFEHPGRTRLWDDLSAIDWPDDGRQLGRLAAFCRATAPPTVLYRDVGF